MQRRLNHVGIILLVTLLPVDLLGWLDARGAQTAAALWELQPDSVVHRVAAGAGLRAAR